MSKQVKKGDFPDLDRLFARIAQAEDIAEAIDANLPNEAFSIGIVKIIEELLAEDYDTASLTEYLYNSNAAPREQDPRLALRLYRDTIISVIERGF